ncbi:MAG: methylmalonyl-CoA mutase [Deltaproteobacteria bacterium]|nr:MAG: methylmalonyl-CoA mutase [Deltaproteobacteria bacterium]
MEERKIRILLGKLGEGHKETLLVLARNFSEAGFEVIYTELQEPDAIVNSAIQESVDHIGITTLPGSDIQAFAEIRRLLKKENSDYITITAGGLLDEKEIPLIKEMGVMEFFPKGTSFEELIEWSRINIRHKR